ncbi:hypothetical protein CYD30_20855 [Kosakonia cowanii]|nr:hypothetical protein CYD30_20855 [Kosakonia cowanii]
MDRKKLIVHLFPNDYVQDAFALSCIEKQRSGKGDFYRNCFLAGLALSKIDARLPTVMANVLSEDVSVDTIINALRLLNLPLGNINSLPESDVINAKAKEPEKEVIQKARNLFLDN